MKSNLPTTPSRWAGLVNLARQIIPLLLSQARFASEAFADHQLRLAQVEALKELMVQEARTLAEIRREAAQRFAAAAPAERVRIKQDLVEVDRELRRLMVYQKASDHLLIDQASESAQENKTVEVPSMSESWVDRFDQFARSKNEPWRFELLANAMAKEAANPGTISTRALWFIGTVEEKTFHAFGALLNACMRVGKTDVLTSRDLELQMPGTVFGPRCVLGELAFMLANNGLIGEPISLSTVEIPANKQLVATYGDARYLIDTKADINISGIVLTEMGGTIANLMTRKPTDTGVSLFAAWIKSIRVEQATVSPLEEHRPA
jgi:hypothetical protein